MSLTIQSWEEADQALLHIKQARQREAALAATFDAQIAHLQEEKALALKAHQEEVVDLEQALKEWTREHPPMPASGKAGRQRKLVHGIVSQRETGGRIVFLSSEEETLRLCKARGRMDLIVLKESLSKEELRKLSDRELLGLGVRVERELITYYKVTGGKDVQLGGGAS